MKVINLEFLLDVLVSGYFMVEEFGICIFLGFDLVSDLGLRLMFQATGWVFEDINSIGVSRYDSWFISFN